MDNNARDPESRWPNDSDRMFVESAWAHDARLTCDPSERFYRLPMGFKRAADILIERANADPCDRQNVIYAALYCYRQSIELYLKRMIDEFGPGAQNTHDLKVLWDRFMEVIHDRTPQDSIGLEAARRLVGEMHDADRKSDGFRFPAARDGAPFPFGDRGVDLVNLFDVMAGLENFFECVYMDYQNWTSAYGTT
jgi:hypothetical protein